MKEYELPLVAGFSPETLETLLAQLGLEFSRLNLKKHSGCVHWHIKKPGSSGTLEATWIPGDRLWLSVHTNRAAAWQDPVITMLSQREHGVTEDTKNERI